MDLKGKKVLVIGGAGLIGSHTVDRLMQEDVAEIRIYDNFTRGKAESLAGALRDPRVQVFPLRVTRQHKQWPEKHQRQTRWYRPRDAARFVKEPSLRRLIRKFAKQR